MGKVGMLIKGWAVVLGLLIGAVVLGTRPASDDPAARYLAMQQAERTLQEQQAAAARWATFWAWVTPVGTGVVTVLLVGVPPAVAAWLWDARRHRLVQLGPAVVWADHVIDGAAYPLQAAVIAGHYQALIAAGQAGGSRGTPVPVSPGVTPAPVPQLPGLVTLDTLLAQGWRPTPDRLLLGLGPGDTRYEVPADDKLCHVLTVGRTGYGKSSFNRLLLPQLIACGFDVYLLDVDYTPVDPKNGEEWWPIAQRTAPGDALYELDDIRAAIEDAAAEVDRRHVLRRQRRDAGTPVPWTPRFYAIEEAPELTSRYPELMDKLAHVLRRGRRVDVFALLIAQSALIKVIGGNSGDRGQFGTVAYMGGEPTSAQAILGKGPEPAGRGLARLKCYGVPVAVDARIPYGTNSGIRALLGTDARPVSPVSPPFPPVSAAKREPVSGEILAKRAAPPEMDPQRVAAVREAVQAGLAQGKILEQIWAVKAGGGAAYNTATEEFRNILAWLVTHPAEG